MKSIVVLSFLLMSLSLRASSLSKVDRDIKDFDDKVQEMNSQFAVKPVNPSDKNWVKEKIQHMRDIDQYMRGYLEVQFDHGYSDLEKQEFMKQFLPRWSQIDTQNTKDLKELMAIYVWFSIGDFDEKTDSNAWLLVQHADLDFEFQKATLATLEKLVLIGETSPKNYAYLFDRVAASWNDASKRQKQRYGTQGGCTGPGQWEPIAMEEPSRIDRRRSAVGLPPEAEYIDQAKAFCK